MDIQFYYAGENAQKVYEPFVPALTAAFKQSTNHSPKWQWDKGNNTLRVLLVTPKDIDPSQQYKRYDWSLVGGCTSPITKQSVDAYAYLGEGQKKLYQTLMISASAKNGFMQGIKFPEIVLKYPASVMETIGSIVSGAMTGSIGINNISMHITGLDMPMAVVTLKDTIQTQADSVKELSSLDIKYFSRLRGDDKVHNYYTLGHEIIGHGIQGHRADPGSLYNCAHIDYGVSDRSAIDEAEADIAGSMTLRVARAMSLVKVGEDFNEEIEALRAIANIMKTSNRFNVNVTNDVNSHVTTVHFDPRRKDYKGAFAANAELSGFTAIPPLIVTLSDIVTGYVHALHMADRAKKRDKNLTPTEIDNYSNEIKNPAENAETAEGFAQLGANVRFGALAEEGYRAIERNPAWVVASFRYLKKSGGIEAIKAQLRPALRPVVDDIVDDFLRAVDIYGSPLLRNQDAHLFEQHLPKTLDYKAILADVMELDLKTKRLKDRGEAPHHPVPRHILASPRP